MRETVRRAGRATVLLAKTAGMAFGSYLFITFLLIAIVGTVVVIGIGALPESVLMVRKFAAAKRRYVAEWTGREIPEAYQPLPTKLKDSVRAVLRDPCTYADLRWMFVHYAYSLLAYLAVLLWPVGLVVDGVWCRLFRRNAVVLPLINRLADLDAKWSEALLKPPPKARLAQRVEQLTETRAGAIAAHGAELRRIERDLHDGTQACLVSLSMRIGLAKRMYDRDPQSGRKMLDEAQALAEQALTELRTVVRGIHPPILTDRGLVGAVQALAAGSALPVAVRVDGVEEGTRAPAAIEAAAYFVVAEALTNATKHSGCDRVEICLVQTGTSLRVAVRDDGRGGVENLPEASGSGRETDGTGLVGMRRRVAAMDGTMTVISPAGGPTVIDVELPCVW
ncbi:signal transduction histidine kinase [Kibdelosporangium banguiense]|uniref:histidine kinase n=1 Tax=Kibdelosporangium banguiense TaxID=1365924 RepID=A0ABS4U1F2_9PSEU|nr:sensor histidine kinase [Kibdelosporangium banguiense]MBP2330484.1 signal transduction histidine kinase [Kibdelosporangium banguiense]